MAEAVIPLRTGGTVTVTGTPSEVAEIVREVGLERHVIPSSGRALKRLSLARKPGIRTGPLGYTRELKSEGFFKTEKTLVDVQAALRAAGHIYSTNDLSPALVRLVRQHQLGRIKGKDGMWQYVER